MDSDQQQQFFALMAQQGAGMSPGYNPLEAAEMGIPGLGPLNMLFQPAMMALGAQHGLFPGQFQPKVNVADQMQAMMAYKQLSEEMSKATNQVDMKNWLKTSEGAVRMMGGAYGLDQQAGFMNAYRNAAPIMSILAQVAPELIDQLHGVEGSAAVMTQGLFRGGQYRANMTTGLPGMRDGDFETLSKTIHEELYGSPDKIFEMQGVGMGQLGKIFDEAQRRGYMSSSISTRSKSAQMDAISSETGETVEELSKLDNEDFGRKMREFDSKRVAGRLKDLAGSITAMRDLFGSMGQANAPISQLVNALEALTQNRLASMPPAQVEGIVRKTKALMETTGISLDGLMGLTSIAANYGDQTGLDRTLAITAAQHAAGFSTAYKQTMGSDYTAFGALSPDQLAHGEAIRMQKAAGSEQAQFAGAVVRTAEAFKLDETTQAGRLAAAIRRGETTFDGKSMFDVLRMGNLQEIMKQDIGADGASSFTQAARDRFGNQEYIQKYDIGSTVRRLQPIEMTRYLGAAAGQNAIMRNLMDGGMSQKEAREAGRMGGGKLLQAILDEEDPAKKSTAEGRRAIIQKVLTEQFGAEKAEQMAPGVALTFESQFNSYARQRGLGDLGKVIQTQSTSVLKQEERVQRMAAADAEVDKALSPLGRAGPIARVIDLIKNSKNDDAEIGKLVGKGLGGIEVSKIRELMKDTETIKQLTAKEGPLSDEDKAALKVARDRVESTIEHVKEEGKKGADVGRVVDTETVDRLTGTAEEVKTGLAEKDPKKRISRTATALRMELTRTNNFAQALYLDDASMKKLGKGGLERVQSLEAKYTQLLHETGGDTEMLAKALANDASVPKEVRDKVQKLHKSLEKEAVDIGKTLKGDGKVMTDDEFKDEKKKLEEFRDTRTATDADQSKKMIDEMAKLGGIDPKGMSEDERKQIKGLLGGFGTAKRKDIMLAMEARERLQANAEKEGVTVEQLRKRGKFADDFAQAGGLADFADKGKDDVAGLTEALKEFGPNDSTKLNAPQGEKSMRITGTLNVRTGELAGMGYSDMGGGA